MTENFSTRSSESPKKIMVLAGGSDQIALIQTLNKRYPNAETILIDYNENPLAKPYATRHIQESTLDMEKVLSIAIQEKIDLIITACTDQALLTMAYVSEKMSIPCYLTYNQAHNLTNKLYMKKLMIEGEIPTTKYQVFDSASSVDVSNLHYPLVVKPVDNNSSNGISKVYSPDSLDEALLCAENSSRSNRIIVEEFKEGIEYSVDAYLLEGNPEIVLITETKKIPENNNRFTIYQSYYPTNLPAEALNQLKRIIAKIGVVFQISTSPLLLQVIYDGEGVSVIEFSARTGGGSKYYLIDALTGEDVLNHLLDITYGDTPVIAPKHSTKFAAMTYVYANPGVFSGVRNLQHLIDEDIIKEYFLYKPFGTQITKSETSSDRPMGYYVEAKSHDELVRKIQNVEKHLSINDESGNNIIRYLFMETP